MVGPGSVTAGGISDIEWTPWCQAELVLIKTLHQYRGHASSRQPATPLPRSLVPMLLPTAFFSCPGLAGSVAEPWPSVSRQESEKQNETGTQNESRKQAASASLWAGLFSTGKGPLLWNLTLRAAGNRVGFCFASLLSQLQARNCEQQGLGKWGILRWKAL